MLHSARIVIDLAPDYCFLLMGFPHSRSAMGVGDSPAKPKSRVTCMKTNSGVVFYTSDLCLPDPGSLDYLEGFTGGAIVHSSSPQVIYEITPQTTLSSAYRYHQYPPGSDP